MSRAEMLTLVQRAMSANLGGAYLTYQDMLTALERVGMSDDSEYSETIGYITKLSDAKLSKINSYMSRM